MYSDAISGEGRLPLPLTQYSDLIGDLAREMTAHHALSEEEEMMFLQMLGLM